MLPLILSLAAFQVAFNAVLKSVFPQFGSNELGGSYIRHQNNSQPPNEPQIS